MANGARSRPQKDGLAERQLVAITFSGDWYRLRIPDELSSTGDEKESSHTEKDDAKQGYGSAGRDKDRDRERDRDQERRDRAKKGKCELVEYRRLGVGGGGW
jgi:hypothetical protein